MSGDALKPALKKDPPKVFASHAREYLAALDQALGYDIRVILTDASIPAKARVAQALDLMCAHVATTGVLAETAEHEDDAGPSA